MCVCQVHVFIAISVIKLHVHVYIISKVSDFIFTLNSENRRVSDIGFVAFLSTNFNTTANGTIIFDEVGNEGGGGYNNRTGVFTVPVAGVYHIYFSILSEGGSASEINLMLHYRAKTGYLLRAYIAASQKYHTPSASVYFRLDVGNKVYLKASRSGAILDSDRFSSFGAQLITYWLAKNSSNIMSII